MKPSNNDRRIFLGMPGYGSMSAYAARGFYRACADMSGVMLEYRNGSLLASNFNQLWCHALNIVHQGGRIDYFAMLHDDIGPQDFWLDTLIDELEAKELDVLGVAVAIKDTRGLTSLALHKPDSDSWLPGGRLTMHDVYKLPETFTSDELNGMRLLLNTGCWVCKFDMSWMPFVHFEINDRIVFNRACNLYQAQTEPEDWGFSRMLHEIGGAGSPTDGVRPLRIGATRKIAALHRGAMDFPNDHAWGTELFDSESCTESPVKDDSLPNITGWLHRDEAIALAEICRGKNVLEIGSYCGLSTVAIGRTANHVTAVDYFDGRGTPEPRNTLAEFESNIAKYGLTKKVYACHPDSMPPLDNYDIVFIDGAHDAESIAKDFERAVRVLNDDGQIIFHDYGHPAHQAVKEFVDSHAELISITNTLAVVKAVAIPLEV